MMYKMNLYAQNYFWAPLLLGTAHCHCMWYQGVNYVSLMGNALRLLVLLL